MGTRPNKTKPGGNEHRTRWEARPHGNTERWGELNQFASEWSREYAGEKHGTKGTDVTEIKSSYPQAHGNGGEALIGEARLIAATRRRL